MVLNGLDHLADAAPWLKGRRLGLITSTSGVTRMLTSGIDAIHAQFPLTALFGPEHGVRGDHDAGATVETYTDPATGRWAIEDLGSTNGTVVNHQRLNAPMILGARVPVRIGATTFELR